MTAQEVEAVEICLGIANVCFLLIAGGDEWMCRGYGAQY